MGEVSDIFCGKRGEGAELAGNRAPCHRLGSSSVVPSLPQLWQLREWASSPTGISLFTALPPPAHSHHCWAQPAHFLPHLPLRGLPCASPAENPESSLPWPSNGCDSNSGNTTGQLSPLLPRVSGHPEHFTGIKHLKSSCAYSARAVGCAGSLCSSPAFLRTWGHRNWWLWGKTSKSRILAPSRS